MRKKTLKCITTALLVALLITVFPAEFCFAAVPDPVNTPSEVTTFKSTENFDLEYLRAYVTQADDRVLKVVYRTPLETSLFRLSLYRTGEDKGDLDLDIFITPKKQYASDGTLTYNFTYYLNMEGLEIPDGKYTIYIRRCASESDAANLKYTNSGVLNKNMIIKVTDGKVRILRYKDVISYNQQIQKIGDAYTLSRYTDQSLEDIRFVLRNPATNTYASMTSSKISFIQGVSNRVTSGISSDYDKLRKIYEYTASNFYYDSVAFQTHSNQYANPYDNIRNFEYGLTSANSLAGRVYTTCQGYSAIFVALARAQGIPARLVYGHRAAVPSHDWVTESNISTRDHWWVEAWADGRWIFIDPTVGTTNKYNSSTGKWTSTGLTNYTYFDPSDEQIATSHLYFNIYPDYRYGYYIENPYEIETLRTFLNSWSTVEPDSDDYSYGIVGSQIQNGKILNSAYSAYDYKTWGNGTKSHFMTDGRGNVSQIQWSNYGFTGDLSLPNFTSMKVLSSHGNEFETANLSGCTNLEKIYLYGNNIHTMDLSNCYNAWYIRCKNNPLKDLTVYVNGRNRTFTAGEHGTFYFTIDTRYVNSSFSLYSKPDVGYKLQGVYSTTTGSRLSTKSTWHFTPNAAGYNIVFCLNPNSYKYSLVPGDNTNVLDYKADYLEAALARLQELGYYTPSYYANQTIYTGDMVDAAIKFQVVNDLPNTGTIDKETWSILFSENAQPMVDIFQYYQVLADYEARRQQEEDAATVFEALNIKSSSALASNGINISWSASQISTNDFIKDAEISSILSQAGIDGTDTSITSYLDGYEVWRSTSKTSGYKLMKDTANNTAASYKNTAGLKKGTCYYYKVRAYKLVGEKKIYSEWSNVVYRTMK